MKLCRPTRDLLPGYVEALRRGWSPNNLRPEAAQEQLSEIASDPDAFLAGLDSRTASGMVTLQDGSQVPRLPSFTRWIWDGAFCGHIGLRWQPGTEDLPPTCPGHIGYGVVEWKRGQGLATAALMETLTSARDVGLGHVILTTFPGNVASIRTIEKAGGVFLRQYRLDPRQGARDALEYRIDLRVPEGPDPQ